METCPWCNAPREGGPACARCGANYAKADMIRKQGRATEAVALAASPQIQIEEVPAEKDAEVLTGLFDPALEFKFCVGAIPIALACGVAFHLFMPFLQRSFLGMPVHETGHAVAAWFTGHWAVPTPLWFTINSPERSLGPAVVLLGAIGAVMYYAWRIENRALLALGGVLALLQAIGTLFIKAKTADALIVFGGDGIGMVLATALMSSFFFGKGTQLYQGSLRWGFLVIGAGAFTDMFSVWWAARSDFGKVPFGEQERAGPSDANKLVDDFNWSTDEMIHRYVVLGICCLAALALVYAWGVWQARRKIISK